MDLISGLLKEADTDLLNGLLKGAIQGAEEPLEVSTEPLTVRFSQRGIIMYTIGLWHVFSW